MILLGWISWKDFIDKETGIEKAGNDQQSPKLTRSHFKVEVLKRYFLFMRNHLCNCKVAIAICTMTTYVHFKLFSETEKYVLYVGLHLLARCR